MPRRRGRPGLVGTVGRTAVVAGTATAVSGSVAQRQQAKATTQQHAPPSGPQVEPAASAPMPSQPAAAPPPDTMLAELERLVELRQQGLLTDEEFSGLKARLIEG